MVMASAAKTTTSEYYLSSGNMPDSTSQAGINTDPAQSDYVSLVTFATGTGVASLTYTLAGLGGPDGSTIVFVGTGSANGVAWVCTDSGADAKYLPANCRP